MAFCLPGLRPVLCCSGVSRALFVRPSLCGSVASASAAAAAGCSDRFGFTSRDGSVAAPGGAESLARFLRGVSAAACPVPGSGFGGCSRVWWWCRFRRWFRLWLRLRVSVPALVLAMVPALVLAVVPGAVALSVPAAGSGGAGVCPGCGAVVCSGFGSGAGGGSGSGCGRKKAGAVSRSGSVGFAYFARTL